jgi:hypothetical protein
MPIRPFLAGQPFDPDTITEMSLALQSVCGDLGIKRTDDALNREVAAKIIVAAQRGVRGQRALHAAALKEIRGR